MQTRVAVIGAGPGGYVAAFRAADLGMAVTLVDEAPKPGGVCLYRGCMPSKALLHAARVVSEAREAERWGIAFGEPAIDPARLRAWKDEVVAKLTGGLALLARQRGVTCVQGRGAFADAATLSVGPAGASATGEASRVAFDHAIIATGSRPTRPGPLALDDPRVLDSTGALDIDRIPKSLLVVGGGYIGLELGTVYAALGADVTIVEMTGSLLPGADADLVRVLARRMNRIAAAVHVNTTVRGLTPRPDGIEAALSGSAAGGGASAGGGPREWTERFDAVLVAVGRTPNSGIEGLDRTRVERDERGFIRVDAQRRTAEPAIFAVGDVTGEPMLAHKAFAEAGVAVETIAGRNAAFAPRAIPAVVFTDPEVAWCGLTEMQAAREGRDVRVARFPWGASGRALTLDRPEGVTKLVIDPGTERVLGVGIAGVGAGELIAEGVLAVEQELRASELGQAIHAHPTLSETMGEAAEAFLGQSAHIYRPKR
ncbi:MAG: dihydrolipoyl dehydrogenase [Acidobacteria bacterium]|nr:dihydrolipoyl dehydrogenase [Acidobacteriota bacterium]MYJ02791.1 dihydrolipoyl dehydrogenase [Acidobacteriota bacterium]